MKFSEEKSSENGTALSQVTPQNSKLIVSKKIWNHMSPKSKYKVAQSLKASPKIPKGLNSGLQKLETLVHVFRAPNNMFAYTIVHLKQSFMPECTLTCISPCTYYKDKANVRSIPLTINLEPSLGIQTLFYRERNNRQVSCLPRTKQPDNFLSTMFESNEHGRSFPVFVGLRQRGCQRTF